MENNTQELAGKIAIVTGATAFIGAAIAKRLASLGANVVVNGRNQTAGDAIVAEITKAGGKASFEKADLLKPEELQNLADRVADKFGSIDILAASGAGASTDSPAFALFKDMELDDFETYIRAHWLTRVYAIKAVYPHMKKAGGGRIIAIGTDAGRVATVGESFIGGSTAGMMQMCRALSREFGRDNIHVNSVAMSFISDAVPRWGMSASEGMDPSEKHKGMIDHLKKRMMFDVHCEDIAKAVSFFAGSGGDAVTGQTLSVNGGLSTF